MPAVTLKHRTTHSSQNCGVRIALRAETFAVVISLPVWACAGSHPAGFQSGAGTRMSSQPTDRNKAEIRAITRDVWAIPLTSGFAPAPPNADSSWLVSGDAI